MPYKLRTAPCVMCGKPHSRRVPAGTVMRCPPCAIAYSAENARQIAAGEGPMYDRWLWATVTWARSKRLAIRTSDGRISA